MSRAIVCDIINTDYQSARIQFKAVSVNVAKIQEGCDGWITAGAFMGYKTSNDSNESYSDSESNIMS